MGRLDSDVLIVGASLAGVRATQALRRAGFAGRIAMVGDERHHPYDRPPLSKGVLAGTSSIDDVSLLTHEELADLDVDLALGTRAVGLDLAARRVRLDGRYAHATFTHLVIATGSRSRKIATFDGIEGAHTLRTIDDSLAIANSFASASSLVVVGGGFIGFEVASVALERGLAVTLLEGTGAPLSRVLGPQIGERLARPAASCGVDIVCNAMVDGPVSSNGRLTGVLLGDGSRIDGDVAVIGVGSVPNVEWLAGSRLDTTDGVRCNARGRADDRPDVHALGDVARWYSERFADCVRTEHWTNVNDQAMIIAADIVGATVPDEPMPYVWSDQFGHRIQVAGRCRHDDEAIVISDSDDAFLAVTGRGGRLTSVLAMDDPRGFATYRKLLLRGSDWEDVHRLVNAS